MTPESFAAAWGEHLTTFSSDVLTPINIPTSSKRFLMEGGLPRQAPLFTDLHGLHLLPPVAPTTMLPGADELRLLEKAGDFWPLAIRWYRCLISLDQQGQIVTYSDRSLHQGIVWLMNSDIAQFAETLLACRTARERLWERWPADYAGLMQLYETSDHEQYEVEYLSESIRLQGELQRIDPKAMAQRNSYWSGVLRNLAEH